MAEQAPAIQSKRLLVVAVILAAIVVVIYNVHVSAVRTAGRNKTIDLLQFSRDMDPDEEVTKKDVHVVPVDKLHYGALGNVVTRKDFDLVVGSVLNQPGAKNEFVKYGHVTSEQGTGASGRLGKGMVAVSLELDPRNALGDVLQVHDRVNILAILSPDRKKLKTYRVIEGVRVIAVGGRGQAGRTTARGKVASSRAPRTYRSVTVQVPKEISLGLGNVLSWRAGSTTLELCSSEEEVNDKTLKINAELKTLAESASVHVEGSR